MRIARAFGRFWWDLLVGDDWKIAAGVVVALGLLGAVMGGTGAGDDVLAVLGGALVVAAFAVSLAIDTRRRR